MKLKFKNIFRHRPELLIQKCGYGQITNRHNNEVSYVRRLGSQLYPRFHVYVNKAEEGFELSMHLDQKKASYKGQTAHSGDYDGEVVQIEATRILKVLRGLVTK